MTTPPKIASPLKSHRLITLLERLPPEVLIVTLRRDGQVHAVHGETVLETDDELIFLAAPAEVVLVQLCLSGETPVRENWYD